MVSITCKAIIIGQVAAILILPDIDVTVYGQPCPLHFRKDPHAAVALHVTKVLHLSKGPECVG